MNRFEITFADLEDIEYLFTRYTKKGNIDATGNATREHTKKDSELGKASEDDGDQAMCDDQII